MQSSATDLEHITFICAVLGFEKCIVSEISSEDKTRLIRESVASLPASPSAN